MIESASKSDPITLSDRSAIVHESDPSRFLEAYFRQLDQPVINPALSVEAIGFVRYEGDWLGVVVTPWFLNLFLLSGGGRLWGDIPVGQRRYLELPCGVLQFIAEDEPEIGPYQYYPLIAPVSAVADMSAARQVALDALRAVFAVVPVVEPGAAKKIEPEANPRRGFFRRLAGRKPAGN